MNTNIALSRERRVYDTKKGGVEKGGEKKGRKEEVGEKGKG